ncbi:IS701 family transposase [Kitasatospora sp. GAS1066B]|uniref:IS701 family transposase n=1 Tax=Kitasatospora sp. GAS1066B TaxID=3156271 RepID=UPI00351321CB
MVEQQTQRPLTREPGPGVCAFTEALFGHLSRADQRRWARIYLQGLLTTPGRKSVRRLAAAAGGSDATAQSLQQFVNASPWDWAPARHELTRLTERHTLPRAWTIGSAVLPKRGEHSCGVHRRFVPSVGRTINCQLGVGLFVSSGEEHIPVDWQLLLPERWGGAPELRERARIPATVRHQPLWALTLQLVDAMAARTSLARVPVVADLSEHPDADRLVDGLSRRGHEFVLAVPATLPVLPTIWSPSRGYQYAATGGHGPVGARAYLHQHNTRHSPAATLLTDDRRHRHVRMLAGQVTLPGVRQNYRLFSEWRAAGERPARVWLTNLTDHSLDQLTALAALEGGTTGALDELARDFGLLDFEGRSFPGWHHHMTLVSAAYGYRRLTPPGDGDTTTEGLYAADRLAELTCAAAGV